MVGCITGETHMKTRRASFALSTVAATSLLALGCASRDPAPPDPAPAPPAAITAGRTPRPDGVPPPISGGTLLIARDGVTAYAADPDRDRVWIADLSAQQVTGQIALNSGDEPGRLVEDAAGKVHVVLRGGGALLTFDPRAASVLQRRPVCAAPRGVAYDPAADVVHVACATGELVSFAAAGGPPVRTIGLETDLRDVVVSAGRLFVSKFRTAELLEIGADGSVLHRSAPQSLSVNGSAPSQPGTAWRMVPASGGGVLMLHQRAGSVPVSIQAGGYGVQTPMCPTGLVHGAVTAFNPPAAPVAAPMIANAVLPVDLALSQNGAQAAVVAAGNGAQLPQVQVYDLSTLTTPSTCANSTGQSPLSLRGAVAAAFDGKSRLVVQLREPAALVFPLSDPKAMITLPGETRANAGHDLFHTMPNALLACASCHPEAGDDAHVWNFDPIGPRRTQNVRGGVLENTPFHWDGNLKDFVQLANEVFTVRMGGMALPADQVTGLGQWLDAQPAQPVLPSTNPAAVARGKTLFMSDEVGCVGCHGGDNFGSHGMADVGTGGTFKVPSLIAVAYRAPYLHDGCAATLLDRFGSCGGGDRHGKTSQLSASDVNALISYLQTL